MPRDPRYKELLALINFIVRQFLRKVQKQPMLLVEVRLHFNSFNSSLIGISGLFPQKRRAMEGIFFLSRSYRSIWVDGRKGKLYTFMFKNFVCWFIVQRYLPDEVEVIGDYSWSEKLGIAMACLKENGDERLIEWTRSVSVEFFFPNHVNLILSRSWRLALRCGSLKF